MSETVENTQGLIAFDDILDITMAASYHEKLTEMLNHHKLIILDAGEIERIDGADLQMLRAFFKAARSLNIQPNDAYVFIGHSETHWQCHRRL